MMIECRDIDSEDVDKIIFYFTTAGLISGA